jgi:hypothetical protein
VNLQIFTSFELGTFGDSEPDEFALPLLGSPDADLKFGILMATSIMLDLEIWVRN